MKEKQYIDDEDKRLQRSFENEDWIEAKDSKELKRKLEKASDNYFKKNKQVSIRMSEHDLKVIKSCARIEGIPYQTFLGSILHKYSEGRLKEVDK